VPAPSSRELIYDEGAIVSHAGVWLHLLGLMAAVPAQYLKSFWNKTADSVQNFPDRGHGAGPRLRYSPQPEPRNYYGHL